jgi:hypothetical protein
VSTTGHGALPPGGRYWACQYPERPPDVGAVYDRDCQVCRTAMEEFARVFPDQEGEVWQESGDRPEGLTAGETSAAWEVGL